MENTLPNLIALVALLEAHGIQVFIFGGWAEELWGMVSARLHRDIDLLYPAEDLQRVDAFIAGCALAQEVAAKRFEHKRAFTWGGVLVEIILVRNEAGGFVTRFFGGNTCFAWPADTFACLVDVETQPLRIASKAALTLYRAKHAETQAAYQAWIPRK